MDNVFLQRLYDERSYIETDDLAFLFGVPFHKHLMDMGRILVTSQNPGSWQKDDLWNPRFPETTQKQLSQIYAETHVSVDITKQIPAIRKACATNRTWIGDALYGYFLIASQKARINESELESDEIEVYNKVAERFSKGTTPKLGHAKMIVRLVYLDDSLRLIRELTNLHMNHVITILRAIETLTNLSGVVKNTPTFVKSMLYDVAINKPKVESEMDMVLIPSFVHDKCSIPKIVEKAVCKRKLIEHITEQRPKTNLENQDNSWTIEVKGPKVVFHVKKDGKETTHEMLYSLRGRTLSFVPLDSKNGESMTIDDLEGVIGIDLSLLK